MLAGGTAGVNPRHHVPVYHSCFGAGDSMMVYDVWESEEAFNAFGATLMPILESMALDPGTPDVMPIHNVIQ
jgi:hypothetical protein